MQRLSRPAAVPVSVGWDFAIKDETDEIIMRSDFRTLRKIRSELVKRPELHDALAKLTSEEIFCLTHFVLLIDAEQKREDERLMSNDIDARAGVKC